MGNISKKNLDSHRDINENEEEDPMELQSVILSNPTGFINNS